MTAIDNRIPTATFTLAIGGMTCAACAARVTMMLGYFALFGTLFLMSQVLQFVLGYSALASGVRLLPFAVSMVVFSPVSVKLASRIGTKFVVASGLTMVAGGLLWIASLGLDDGYRAYLPGLIILGQVSR